MSRESEVRELEKENKILREAIKGLLVDADESWCTCGSEEGDGCYYHEALEALHKGNKDVCKL